MRTLDNAVKIGLGYQGLMRLVVYHGSDTSRIKQDTGWFGNLITNIGMGYIGLNSGDLGADTFINESVIGSGTAAPAVSDTSLQTQIGSGQSLSGSSSGVVSSPVYTWTRVQYRYLPGNGTGTIKECGIRPASPTSLFSRQLVTPNVVKAAADIMDLWYELRTYPTLSDVAGTVLLDTSYSFTLRASEVDIASSGAPAVPFWLPGRSVIGNGDLNLTYPATGAIGSTTGSPAGAVQNKGQAIWANLGVTNDITTWSKTLQMNVDLASWVITGGGGFKSISIGFGACKWQAQFTPNIVKTSLDLFSMIFRVNWTRYSP